MLRDEHGPVRPHRDEGEPFRELLKDHDRKVDAAAFKGVRELLGDDLPVVDPDLRVGRAESRDDERQELLGPNRRNPDRDLRLSEALHVGDPVVHAVVLEDHFLKGPDAVLSLPRQRDRPCVSFKNAHVQLLLDALELLGQRRLGEPQVLGGFLEAARAVDLEAVFHLADVHFSHPLFI